MRSATSILEIGRGSRGISGTWTPPASGPGARQPEPERAPAALVDGGVVTLFAELDMSRSRELWADRAGEGSVERFEDSDLVLRSDRGTLTYDDLFIHAAGRALRDHPQLLAQGGRQPGAVAGTGDPRRVHIGITCLGPQRRREVVIADADTRSLAEIAHRTSAHADLVWREAHGDADAGADVPPTFTVANLGVWGVDRCSGVIRSGQRAMLTVGEVRRKPVCAADGRIVGRHMVSVGLTVDSRQVDPVEAACFLETLQLRLDETADRDTSPPPPTVEGETG